MGYPRTEAFPRTKKSPVVDDTVDRHPLWLDAKTIVFLLHLSIVWIFHLALVTLPIILTRAIVQRGGLIHVILPLVVSVHYQVEDFQLMGHRGWWGRDNPTVPENKGKKEEATRGRAWKRQR